MSNKTESDSIEKIIKKNHEGILSCEIGALLHLLGKLHKNFLEDPENASAVHKDHVKKSVSTILYKLKGSPPVLKKESSVAEYIDNKKLLNTCHRKSGAEEKGGLVDPKNDKAEHLVTPFGKKLHCLLYNDLCNLGLSRGDVKKLDTELFDKLSNMSVKDIRKYLYNEDGLFGKMLRIAPGETRKPGNDLSLWDQSFATASLYKPAIVMAVVNRTIPDGQNIRWRLLRIHTGARAFLHHSKKLQDLLARRELLDKLMKRTREIIEVNIPVGNLILVTDHEMYFTFPAVNSEQSVKIIDAIKKELEKQPEDKLQLSLGYELGLSLHCTESSRLASECLSGKDKLEKKIKPVRPIWKEPEFVAGKDACPVCGIRSLRSHSDESCKVCGDRTRGRLSEWSKNREGDTIWIGELADRNNKIALLTFSLDLDRWLSGEWFSTICSNRMIDGKPIEEPCEEIREEWKSNKEKTARLLELMLPTVKIKKEDTETHLSNLSEWFGKSWNCTGDRRLTASDLATRVGTLNPSTGRLLRVIKEAENFSEKFIEMLRNSLSNKRLIILLDGPNLVPGRTYELKIQSASNNVSPKSVQVIATSGNTVSTIESMALFDRDNRDGADVLEENIRKSELLEFEPEEEQRRESNPIRLRIKSVSREKYWGLTLIGKTPFLFKVMIPADRVAEITKELIETHYRKFFGLVEGKLPLNVSIAVAKQKFPLYALMEAGERMICRDLSSRGRKMKPWWDYPANDESFKEMKEYFKFYPTESPRNENNLKIFEYANLDEISREKEFWLTPGYFDFEYLSSTSDLNHIYYSLDKENAVPIRNSTKYGWYPSRPLYTHRFIDMEELWSKIKHKSNSKMHNVEEILLGKLMSWKYSNGNNNNNKDATFVRFADATLRNYLEIGINDIQGDKDDQRIGLLLDTLQFHLHVLG